MRFSSRLGVAALVGMLVLPLGQDRPLERSFTVGAVSRYRVTLRVRTALEGQQPVQIGAKTYVKPFSRAAEGQLSWRATRQVVAVGADGTAQIEEKLDEFDEQMTGSGDDDEEAAKLLTALRATLQGWETDRTLAYREGGAGQFAGLKPEGVPAIGEAAPPLLTLWLLRALRPAAALPATSLRLGEQWQEPRTAQLPNWTDVRGTQSGEWLEVPGAVEPAVRLHVVQQLSGTVVAGEEKPPEGAAQARFHSESLSTLALDDGRLLAATRSAKREVTWTLAPVEGLSERPQFRATLSVEVQIESCNENQCLASGARAALRQRD
jgi:hypothetical protein